MIKQKLNVTVLNQASKDHLAQNETSYVEAQLRLDDLHVECYEEINLNDWSEAYLFNYDPEPWIAYLESELEINEYVIDRHAKLLAEIAVIVKGIDHHLGDDTAALPAEVQAVMDAMKADDIPNDVRAMRQHIKDLESTARAVIERWETPLWKDVAPTAEYINRLRCVVDGRPYVHITLGDYEQTIAELKAQLKQRDDGIRSLYRDVIEEPLHSMPAVYQACEALYKMVDN